MYKRNEVIKEEHLDWDKQTKDKIQKKDDKVTLSSETKKKEKKQNLISTLNKKILITPIHTIREMKETTSYMGEKITFFLLLIIFPYLLGTFLFFILMPLLAGIDLNILFLAIDFFDGVTHFIFWAIGYIILTFLGIFLILYKQRY